MPTVAELRVEAQRLNIPNYKDMRKAELTKVLEKRGNVTTSTSLGAKPVSPLENMRRSELAHMYKGDAGQMTKDQLIAALSSS